MEILKYHALALTIGYVLDLIIGDPHSLPHPIRLIGRFIGFIEEKTYEDKKSAGFKLVLLVVLSVILSTTLVLYLSYKFNYSIGTIVEAIFTFYCLATKSLKDESNAVVIALNNNGIIEARKSLSMIVGRDTNNLGEEEILKAAVETVAENTSDGVIAPLIYLSIGGPILGMAYKAINTMDSMVGYKNDRYTNYGFFAAKIDDVANFLPSRICAILIIIATYILGIFDKKSYDGFRAFTIWKRDRLCHKSPNSAQSEAAYAGALGLRLAGGAYYFGKYIDKPYIGDAIKSIERSDVAKAHRLLYATSILCIVLCTVVIFITTK